MRTREHIEREVQQVVRFHDGERPTERMPLELEVLLDIRDLLEKKTI